ncbi:hypothetical protein O0L34_g18132 [Tuta absoluta]|nr:hypothetical protein O0L34_g18132 [Tuta absoluta]
MASSNIPCFKCDKAIPRRYFLNCMVCKCTYDLNCAGVSDKIFDLMTRKDQWKCRECRSNRTNASASASKTKSEKNILQASPQQALQHKQELVVVTQQKNITSNPPTKTNDQTKPAPEIDHKSNSESVTAADLKTYLTELINTQVQSLREAITNLTDVVKAQSIRMEQLEARVLALENKPTTDEQHVCDVKTLENTISHLQAELCDRDQALLINDLEISGCPESTNENCTHLAIAIAKKIGVELDERDIVSAERAGPPRAPAPGGAPARPRPLAVRLARRAPRDDVLHAARVRRGLDTSGLHLPGPATPLYVNERMTKRNRQLFQTARKLAVELKFKFVWTHDGKVFVRQEQGAPRHRLRSEEDLIRVFGQDNI